MPSEEARYSSVGDEAMFRPEAPEGRTLLGLGLCEAGEPHMDIARRQSQVAASSLEASVQHSEPNQFKENLERVRVGVCPQHRGDVHRDEDS
jgi:hypothetical protein